MQPEWKSTSQQDAVALSQPSSVTILPEPRPINPKITLGYFSYLNVRPVYYDLLHQRKNEGILLETGVPTHLNRCLLNGTIDFSCISSYSYAQHYDKLVLIPGFSISAPAAVESVLLFSRYNTWEELDGKKIALTDHSASSINLLRVLCDYRYKIRPRFVQKTSDLDKMFTDCDAALIIGDQALIEFNRRRDILNIGRPRIFDLSQEWADWMGLPFVFGVWAARADRIEKIRKSGILGVLHDSKKSGLAHLQEIDRFYAPALGLEPGVCTHYLQHMTYDLSSEDQEGLRCFLHLSLPRFDWKNVRWA